MTTMIKTDGQYVVKPGDNLSKIASTQGVTLAELLASNPEYASNPNLIHPGDVVKTTTSAPQLSDLTPASTGSSTTNTGVPASAPNNKTTFTEALLDILKTAQGQNDAGQQQLNVQKNLITGQGINDAIANFKDPLLTPQAGSSLGMSAQRQFDPALESIAQQQERGNKSTTALINNLQDAYDKEQNRIADAKKESANNSSGIKLTPTDKKGLLAAGFLPGEISSIESDVNKYGINKVLEGITDTKQKTAIQKVYGGTTKGNVTKAQLETTVTQKMATDGLKEALTENELKDLADQYGYSKWITGKAKDIDRFLNSPEARTAYVEMLYKQYQAAGMAD